jgi:hypothetical protein
MGLYLYCALMNYDKVQSDGLVRTFLGNIFSAYSEFIPEKGDSIFRRNVVAQIPYFTVLYLCMDLHSCEDFMSYRKLCTFQQSL